MAAVVRPVTPEELPTVCELLEAAGRPTAGLAAHTDTLFVLTVDGAICGAVGYEDYRPAALLRSLVVAPALRGRGYGRLLTDFVLAEAARRGCRAAYCLTTTIPDLLARYGFAELTRDELPPALCAAEDLRGACPLSARVFGRTLAGAPRLRVLFLCTGNSCRSQMAEGWARFLKGDLIEPYSAGIEKHGMNPLAVRVMAEAGVDISRQYSKTTDELGAIEFHYVVTVCDRARESCPLFPGNAKVIHAGFDDPPALAKNARSEEEALAHYRRVRDEIRAFVQNLPEALVQDSGPG